MRLTITVCDYCRTEGKFRRATGRYRGDTQWWDACGKHMKAAKGLGLPMHKYPNTGNYDESRFNE
jgi:hypothetical protein